MDNEKKYTEEEIKAIVTEEIRKANLKQDDKLSPDELESVSGGVYIPPTHEEIDKTWDLIEDMAKNFGMDVASIAAADMKLISKEGAGSVKGTFQQHSLQECRRWMHDRLDGKQDKLTKYYTGI